MATKPLRSIKFPGLTDTYTIAATDTTLSVAGDPADAKAAGDAIAAVDALATAADSKATVAAALAGEGLIDYGYGSEYDGDITSTLTMTRRGMLVTLNGTVARSSNGNPFMIRLNGTPAYGGTAQAISAFTDPLMTLVTGHQYRFNMHRISGSFSGDTMYAGAVKSGTYANFGTHTEIGDDFLVDFTAPAEGVQVGVRVIRKDSTATLTNLVLLCTLEDLTAQSDTVEVSGSTPTITAETGKRYICGEVSEISFTPSASGLCEVRFTSGTTAAVLTLPQTVVMPDWWTGVEAGYTYEISIADGIYGAVMAWPT